jgi:hypothetical protein
MADNIIGILLKGKDEATRVISGVNKEIDKLAGGSTKAATAMKLLGSAVVVDRLTKYASAAFDVVMGLDAMREESEQISARFVAQAGSTRNASDALSAMNAIVGESLTNDEKMAASGQLMALGLAQSSTEAANLANIAVNLGDKTQGAAARIEGLTQIMVSGRLVGLKNYGISMQDVNALALEMQRETAGLSDIQAKQNAIMQIGTQRLDDYTAAGGAAVTQTQNLTNAWNDYQDALANNVNLGTAKQAIADLLRQGTINLQLASPSSLDQLAGLEADLRNLQSIRDEMSGRPIWLLARQNAQDIAERTAQIRELKGELAEESRWAAGVDRLAGGSREASVAVGAIDTALAGLYAKQEAINVNAVAMAIFKTETDNATASMLGLGAAIAGANFGIVIPNVPDPRAAQGYGAYDAGRKGGENLRDAQVAAGDIISANAAIAKANEEALKRTNAAAAKSYQSEMEAAGRAAASKINGYLNEGINFSKGLSDMTGGGPGGLAPGKNGAFEEIYRLQAWLADGSWAETGQKFAGGDKDKGRKIIEDFQRGIFSPEVIGAIDVDKLASEAGMASLAEKSQAAFAKAIADKAGTGTDVVDSILGFKKNDKGVSAADTAAEKSMSQLASAVGAQVTGKDFVGKMIGYGETIWGYTEEGMLNKAKASTAFAAAIDAMVAASIAAALQ